MRILLSLVIAIGAMSTIASSTASAQVFDNGYQFGTGVGVSRGFFRGFVTPREQPPYFAKFPPVYYSGIVRRPYGISPFAAPPGIAPVELSVPQPVTISNPFFDGEVQSASQPTKPAPTVKDKRGNKVTVIRNPYIESLVDRN